MMANFIISLNRIFDGLWFSTTAGGNYLHIAVYSLVSACFFLLVFKRVSNQEKIAHHKKKIGGYILQMRLYQDKPAIIFSSIAAILKHNIIYIRYTLSSLLAIIIPLLVIAGQINNRSGYAPFEPKQQFIVEARLNDALTNAERSRQLNAVRCETSTDVVIETMPLRIPDQNMVFWRARIDSDHTNGNAYIKIGMRDLGSAPVKRIATAYNRRGFSPNLNQFKIKYALIDNAEGFLPEKSPFSRLSVNYPRATYPFLLFKIDALVLYFILTLGFALIFKPLFKISI